LHTKVNSTNDASNVDHTGITVSPFMAARTFGPEMAESPQYVPEEIEKVQVEEIEK